MAFSIDGLVSGLDTTNMINQLMQLEARPQILLQNKVSATQTFVSGLQQLNSKVASLAELAEKTAKPTSMDLFSTTSSSDGVKATASAGATAGSVDIVVDKLAQAQVSVSATMQVWSQDPAVLTITGKDGADPVEITADSTSLDDVVKAVNEAETGVTAMKVASGIGANGEPQYRLQFTATETGEASAFEVYQGGEDAVAGGTATNLLTQTGAAQIRSAQDATVKLWAGTGAEQIITSASNTFADLLPGVEITATKVSTDPVTVTVAGDEAAMSNIAEDLVQSLNTVFSFISANASVTTSNASGTSSARGGIFTSDSSVRSIEQRIMRAATGPVSGRSPSEIGISITREGAVEFDAEKFATALAEDPDRVKAVVQEIGARVAEIATEASDKFDGGITLRIQGQESLVGNLNEQIMDWDRRLETRRATMERTWSGLEVQLQALQSQGQWLSSQLANLPSPQQSES